MSRIARHDLVPNANSPHLLTRLVEQVGRGVRSTRSLQEALGVEARTVLYYTQAGQWLGLLEPDGEPALTPLGLEYLYAGKHRPAVYARAVFAQPLLARLLDASGDEMPDAEALAAAILIAEPELAGPTVKRRASALRALMTPALKLGRPRAQDAPKQLALPFPLAARPASPAVLGAGKREHDPDAYRYVYSALLDYGELHLGHVRALLDRAGADEAPIGGYVDLALSRGDATRHGDHLCISTAGATRRALCTTTASIVLSDPMYRAYLDDALAASAGDRSAEIRRDQQARKFALWDRRLLGHPLMPQELEADLRRILLDRPLSAYPVATKAVATKAVATKAVATKAVATKAIATKAIATKAIATKAVAADAPDASAPFLDQWEQPGVIIACPPSLGQLQGGIALVNRQLGVHRQRPNDVGLPDVTTRPARVHGALLHPGEPPPRTVPDTRSLRLRALMNAPYVALVAALLLALRWHGDTLSLRRSRRGLIVYRKREALGEVLRVLDAFAEARSYVVSRRPSGGLDTAELIAAMVSLGIATEVASGPVLSERFFGMLRAEAEELEVYTLLQPFAEALAAWIDDAPAIDDTP